MRKVLLSCRKKEKLKRWEVPEGSKLIHRLEKSFFQTCWTTKGKSSRHHWEKRAYPEIDRNSYIVENMLDFLSYVMFYQKCFEIHFISEERDFIVYIIVCDSNISGDDDCAESKPLLNGCFQIKVLKDKLRISILFIFRHCFMLLFPNYPILLITFEAMHVASAARIFFHVSPLAWHFFRVVSLAGIFSGKLSPHLRLFLMVRPLCLSRKLFGDFQVC